MTLEVYQMLYTIYSTNLAQLVPALSPIFFFQTILPTLLYFFSLKFYPYFSPLWGTAGAEMKVPSDADPGLSKVLSSQPKVGQNADLYALPAVRNCAFLSSALPVLST